MLTLCKIVAAPRPGKSTRELKQAAKFLKEKYNAKVELLDIPKLNISSTDIRNRLDTGTYIRGLMPRAAEEYALANNLYTKTSKPDETDDSRFKIAKKTLETLLSKDRFTHTMGVVEEAEKLAAHYGANIQKARWAALLHDCAKEYSPDKKRTLCKLWNIKLDKIFTAHIEMTHSLLGAESARRDFGIEDEEILNAIKNHTTGTINMTLIDKITLLADYIEPYRDDYGPLKAMRALAYTNLNEALKIGMAHTLKSLEKDGKSVHHDGYAALKSLDSESPVVPN